PHIGGSLAFRSKGNSQEIHAVVGTRKKEDAGVYHLRSVDRGKNWDAPTKLGDESATHADLAVNKNASLAAVWDMIDPEAKDGSLAIYVAISPTGIKWAEPIRLSAKGFSASHPRIIPTSLGFLALWTEQSSDGVFHLQMKRIGATRS
ncbi:MAG: hypothetical protein ACKOPC_12430, partial [Methylocystis sp.]